MIWTPEHQKAIEQYYWAFTSTTSAQTRAIIFNTILYSPFMNLCETALKSYNNPKYINEDNIQECLIFVYTNLLPKLKEDKLQGAQNYLYISLKRNIVNIIRKTEQQPRIESLDDDMMINNRHNFNTIDATDYKINAECNNNLLDNSMCADKEFNEDQLKRDIILALDKKIRKEKQVNKSTTIFLLLLKEYLLANNFDERNFKEYCMQKMDIPISTYRAIASRVRISTMLLNKNI